MDFPSNFESMTPEARWNFLTSGGIPEQRRKYVAWIKKNKSVLQKFLELARQMRATGRIRYSARAITHRIRWDYDINSQGGDEFKISNNHVSFLCRHAIATDPSLRSFFTLKTQG